MPPGPGEGVTDDPAPHRRSALVVGRTVRVPWEEREADRMSIKSTAKTTNLEVVVTGELSLDEMEAAIVEVATAHGLSLSHVTTLGRKRYPGNRHWHLKQDPKATGCLDITYWPSGPLMWISIRNYEPDWVHEAGPQLQRAFEEHLGGQSSAAPPGYRSPTVSSVRK